MPRPGEPVRGPAAGGGAGGGLGGAAAAPRAHGHLQQGAEVNRRYTARSPEVEPLAQSAVSR